MFYYALDIICSSFSVHIHLQHEPLPSNFQTWQKKNLQNHKNRKKFWKTFLPVTCQPIDLQGRYEPLWKELFINNNFCFRYEALAPISYLRDYQTPVQILTKKSLQNRENIKNRWKTFLAVTCQPVDLQECYIPRWKELFIKNNFY